jgi:PQQ-like domain
MYTFVEIYRKKERFSDITKLGEYACFLECISDGSSTKLIYVKDFKILHESDYQTRYGGSIGSKVIMQDSKNNITVQINLENGEKEILFDKWANYLLPSKVFLSYNKFSNFIEFFKDEKLLWQIPNEVLKASTCLTIVKYIVHQGEGWKRENNEISVRNIFTGDLLWQTNIEDFPELYPTPIADREDYKLNIPVEKLYYFKSYQNILIICTGWSRVFAFDISTGKLLWNIDEVIGGDDNFYKDQIVKFLPYTLDGTITHVSVKTGEIIKQYDFLKDFKKITKETSFGTRNRISIFEDKLYVVNPRGTIAIFNLETDKLEQYMHYPPLMKAGGPRSAPVLDGDYMYILDNKNKLQVFSRK